MNNDNLRIQKTRFTALGYCKFDTNYWRIIALESGDHYGCVVGPHYHSKAELLADLTRYATDYGCVA